MKLNNFFRNFTYIIAPILCCVVMAGCFKGFRRKKSVEVDPQYEQRIIELENENSSLLSEVEIIRQKEAETNNIRSVAEENLAGTGISVRVKGDGDVSLMLPSSAYFSAGKATLKKEAKSKLKKISRMLNQQFYNNRVRIEGHSDNQPIRRKKNIYKTNWELSAARAISVLYYFIEECGVNPSNIYIAGFAEHEPIASNSSKTGRGNNRRVEVVITSLN